MPDARLLQSAGARQNGQTPRTFRLFTRYSTADRATTMVWRSLGRCPSVLTVGLVFQGLGGLKSFKPVGWPGLLVALGAGPAAFVTVPVLAVFNPLHMPCNHTIAAQWRAHAPAYRRPPAPNR